MPHTLAQTPRRRSRSGPRAARVLTAERAGHTLAVAVAHTHTVPRPALAPPRLRDGRLARAHPTVRGSRRRIAVHPSPQASTVLTDDRDHLVHPLQHPSDHQQPIVLVKGEGAVLTD